MYLRLAHIYEMTVSYSILVPGWTPFLIFYFYWLYRRKPSQRRKSHSFKKMKFTIEVNRR